MAAAILPQADPGLVKGVVAGSFLKPGMTPQEVCQVLGQNPDPWQCQLRSLYALDDYEAYRIRINFHLGKVASVQSIRIETLPDGCSQHVPTQMLPLRCLLGL